MIVCIEKVINSVAINLLVGGPVWGAFHHKIPVNW